MSLASKWYVSVQNKAKGPYSDLQMREKIKSGEFQPETLTYKEGEADWLPLDQQDIWTPGFIPKHAVEATNAKDWVLLVESPIKKGDYQQQGPFTVQEVEEKVQIGEVHLKDFCWRPGMTDWSPLTDTHELGFPRKDKITFSEKEECTETVTTVELSEKKAKPEKMDTELKWDLKSHMPEFVSPDDLVQKDDRKENFKENSIKFFQTKLLPPIIDTEGAKKETLYYLALVAVAFLGAFYLGSMNSRAILNGVETLGDKFTTLTSQIMPAAPKVSYVFLRELPLTRGTVLIKTDGKPGTNIRARVQNEKGKTIKTLDGYSSIGVIADKNGEAFLRISNFKVKVGETYLLTTKVGHLTATKTYFYSNK